MKVLLIQEHDGLRRLVGELLAGHRMTVETFTKAELALAAYPQFQPDWVIADLTGKSYDGLDLTRQLRREHPQARVLLLLNSYETASLEAAHAAGAVACCPKNNPYRLPELLQPGKAQDAVAIPHPPLKDHCLDTPLENGSQRPAL
jgi:DNA-binding NarL/FixJ family response regulator